MPSIKDIFSRLKSDIVGTKTSNIDAKLDSALSNIISYRQQDHRNSYIELIKTLASKSGFELNMFGTTSASATTPAALGQGGRLQRYKMYESITGNINYCHRALNVLVDNIISPDDITKTSLEVKPNTVLEDEKNIDTNTRNVKELIEKLKLERALDVIVKNTLHMGDFFCEIADDKTALTSKSMLLTEGFGYEGSKTNKKLVEVESDIKRKIILDFSSFTEDDKDKKGNKINNINLLYYDPKRVVKLQSNMFPICFGYLVFPTSAISPHLMVQDQIINNICTNILRGLEKNIPEINTDSVNSNDLRDIIRFMIAETDPSKIMNIRYVPPDKMVHFMVPSTKYYPYGESIFDSTQLTARILIALETALAIHRLNRSIEKRKISVEIGLPRDARKSIELLKEEFKKRKISLDSFGTIDTIPSMVTSFEDIFVPMKDGKNFVDIQPFTDAGADTRGKVDELKFLRDQCVASLGIPASFLNIEENLSNKAALSEESILFARTVVNHQKYLTHQVQELILKIFNILDPEKALTILDDVTVAFPSPKSLQFEREAKYMGDLAQLVETLERIGIPKEYSKKRYLTSIDWDEVKKYEIEDKIEKSLGIVPPEDQGLGGGLGSMGGGMYGMGSTDLGGMGGMGGGEMGGAGGGIPGV